MNPALTLDCRGMVCPRPVIELARHLGEVPVGEIIAIVADDAAAATDIPAWCRMRDQEFLGARQSAASSEDGGAPAYLVRRLS